MDRKLCIHCSQQPPCMFQDGIFCKTTPCFKDGTGGNPFAGFDASKGGSSSGVNSFSGNGEDFMNTFASMFGGGAK